MKNDSIDLEMNFLQKVAGGFSHHPLQVNKLNEADAEIINWKGLHPDYLVFKTDGIHEEIREGLYDDPYFIGWMSVTVNMSDIAAVGADPFGILVSLQLPQDRPSCWIKLFQKGVRDACTTYGISVLGGDTNFDQQISVNTCSIATLSDSLPLMRKPMQTGQLLYASGQLGGGSAYAYCQLINKTLGVHYFPTARLKEKKVIRQFASACIDTSDGFFPALSILSTLNSIGLKITQPVNSLLSADAVKVSVLEGIPDWFFLAGPHGEYELLFSVPEVSREAFEAACQKEGWKPLLIGELTDSKEIEFVTRETIIRCPAPAIANIWQQSGGSASSYFRMLMEKDQQWLTQKNSIYAYQE